MFVLMGMFAGNSMRPSRTQSASNHRAVPVQEFQEYWRWTQSCANSSPPGIPCNRERYREFQEFWQIQWQLFRQKSIPRAILQPLRPCLMENRTGNSNSQNRDSIGQIKNPCRGQFREDQYKEFEPGFNLLRPQKNISTVTFSDMI